MLVTLDIPDDRVQGIVDAFCYFESYMDTILNPLYDPEVVEDPTDNPRTIPNPETRQQFALRMLREYVKKVDYRYRWLIEKGVVNTNNRQIILTFYF